MRQQQRRVPLGGDQVGLEEGAGKGRGVEGGGGLQGPNPASGGSDGLTGGSLRPLGARSTVPCA